MNTTTVSKESRVIKFSFLIIFATISMICIVYILYNFIKIRSFRRRFQNEILFILVFLILLNTIFNIPTAMSFYARGYVAPKSDIFCRNWQIIDYIFTASIVWCKALFILERYILVFHPHYLRTIKQKLIIHYIPLILINLYLILFYISANLFGPCTHKHKNNYDHSLCGVQCIDEENGIGTFNWLFNILFPAFIVIFGSFILLIRVLWKRREMQRNLRNWSKNWKMIIQLLAIAVSDTIVWLPLVILSLIAMSSDKGEELIESVTDHFDFAAYLVEMTLPIIALLFWPEIIRKLYRRLRPSAVASITMGVHSTNS